MPEFSIEYTATLELTGTIVLKAKDEDAAHTKAETLITQLSVNWSLPAEGPAAEIEWEESNNEIMITQIIEE